MAITIFPMAEKVSHILGVELKTAKEYARKCRDAGLIRSGGRGWASSKMNVDDIANFILALMASNSAISAPDSVKNVNNCPFSSFRLGADKPEKLPFNFLFNKNGTHKKFGSVMRSILEILAGDMPLLDDSENPVDAIYINVCKPGYDVYLKLWVNGWVYQITYMYRGHETPAMMVTSQIDYFILEEIAQILN